ncbi:TlpA family protein disulfide reductase [Kocuria tytonis]|uniref:TlpA family protein disulfide reductase n=1 Tax=Kocuria tytonis TaxID=2054280 RepID=UPI001F2024F1|nr:TlpA disulfide reductase family protein [Kocuria tytonis]
MNPQHSSSARPAARTRVRTGLVAVVAAVGLALTGCSSSNDNLAQQANAGGDKGYVAGDGSVSEYAPDQRKDPVQFDAAMYDGSTVTAESMRGKPVVLNFWYAGCAPCRAEAPDLVALHEEYGDRARFMGVNLRDQKATAEAFERNFHVDYSSASDLNGSVLLALSDYVPPQAVPTTLVLDSRGRVAARVLGKADKSTLDALIKDTVAESA